jgi:hypothetical protein
MGLKAKKARPYTPRVNGKAERFIKTLLAEWAYVIPYDSSVARNELFPAYLRIYNGRRCRMALWVASPPGSGSLSCRHEQPGGKAHLAHRNFQQKAPYVATNSARLEKLWK